MKTTRYFRTFQTSEEAEARMKMRNRAAQDGTIYCLLDGPEDNFVVADLKTAIETGLPYSWEV
jgi:hypothetical protein